jgi:hypothetical protein
MSTHAQEHPIQSGHIEKQTAKVDDHVSQASIKSFNDAYDKHPNSCDYRLKVRFTPSSAEVEKTFSTEAINESTLLKDGLGSSSDRQSACKSAVKDTMQRAFDFGGMEALHRVAEMINKNLEKNGSPYKVVPSMVFANDGGGAGGGAYSVYLSKNGKAQEELCQVKVPAHPSICPA